ncbi:MAG: FAD-dependent monooxygenase, partial [Geminicoccales bacterium]
TWVEPRANAQHLLEAGRGALLAALEREIDGELGTLELCGRPSAHPLGTQRARRYVAPRVALIGDAAHGVHPIHAQGFNLGVRDVAALAELLVDAGRAGLDPGGGEILVRYDRWRQADARFVIGLTDGLNRLFSTDLAPARWLRGFGFAALERLAPLKQLAMRRGMGLQSGLPKLARGDAL